MFKVEIKMAKGLVIEQGNAVHPLVGLACCFVKNTPKAIDVICFLLHYAFQRIY